MRNFVGVFIEDICVTILSLFFLLERLEPEEQSLHS